ncbi:hypothetical protein QYR09_08440 [Cellulophaga lytica]|nr:hypothetical protein QYR09_08440 [Cellulophaga lytica]
MKKLYYIYANWRKNDVDFINSLDISKKIDIGPCSFSLKEGEDLDKIVNHYSKKDGLFSKTKPKDFEIKQASCLFTKEELNNSKYYAIELLGSETSTNRWPQPNKKQEYQEQIFIFDKYKNGQIISIANKKQISPFKIMPPKWKKTEVCFNLGLEYEYILFKKEFYTEALAPLGLEAMEVIDYKTNKILDDTVQLIIPNAKSKLLLKNSAFDIYPKEQTGGFKQYTTQTLDFFPEFETDFNFHICYSLEDFLGGHKKIIISKEFSKLLINHNIISKNKEGLVPLKNSKYTFH